MVEPDPRVSRLNELRLRLPGLVRGIQEPGITRQRKSELAAEYEQVLGAVLALEVDAFYWTALAPDIVNPGREEQGSASV